MGQLLELDKLLRRDGTLCDPSSAPASFRQLSSNTSVTNITNTSNSLEYALNNINYNSNSTSGVLSDIVSSASCHSLTNVATAASLLTQEKSSTIYSTSSSNRSNPTNSSNAIVGNNVSLTHITQDPEVPPVSPLNSGKSPITRTASLGLYSKASNISTQFGKGLAINEDVRYSFARAGGGIPRSLSLNLKSTLEAVPGSPGSTPQSPENIVLSKLDFNLSPSSSYGINPRTPDPPFRSCGGSAVQSPTSQCSSFSSSIVTLHSPTTDFSKMNFNNNNSATENKQFSLLNLRSPSLKDLISASNSQQGNKSPTIIEVHKSPTITENVFDSTAGDYRSQDNSNNNQSYFSSTATICVAASNKSTPNNNDIISHNESRPLSVCIIEVNTESPVTYVENCSSEPMIVRETKVMATPCTQADLMMRVNGSFNNSVSCENNKNKVEFNVRSENGDMDVGINKEHVDNNHLRAERQHRTLVPIRASASFGNILDRPKVLELCAPIYSVKRQQSTANGASVVGDSTWQTRNPEEEQETNFDQSLLNSSNSLKCIESTMRNLNSSYIDSNDASPTPLRALEKSNTAGIIYDLEGTSVADSSDYNDTASEFSVMQSDSGISFQTDSDSNIHHPIPRCYSSSETHLNTRRLLESNAAGDYATRKSCSNDEVAKNWSSLHKILSSNNSHPLPLTRDSCNNSNSNFGSMNNSHWNYPGGELVRCDSWSTSGLGSELSDWESLQEDANSTHCEDATGPFDAVFSDVFPGEKCDSLDSPQVYHHVFPQLFRGTNLGKSESADGCSMDKKPRHHSFKDPQARCRPQHKQISLARPASLPGVMGSYLAQTQVRTLNNLIQHFYTRMLQWHCKVRASLVLGRPGFESPTRQLFQGLPVVTQCNIVNISA